MAAQLEALNLFRNILLTAGVPVAAVGPDDWLPLPLLEVQSSMMIKNGF